MDRDFYFKIIDNPTPSDNERDVECYDEMNFRVSRYNDQICGGCFSFEDLILKIDFLVKNLKKYYTWIKFEEKINFYNSGNFPVGFDKQSSKKEIEELASKIDLNNISDYEYFDHEDLFKIYSQTTLQSENIAEAIKVYSALLWEMNVGSFVYIKYQ